MVFRSVCRVLALGVAFAGSGAAVEAQQPQYFTLGPGWDAVFDLSTGGVIQQSGDTLWFSTPLPYKINYDTTGIGLSISYNAYTDNGRFYASGSVPGGTQGTGYFFIDPLMDGSVTLTVDALHPLYGYVVESESHAESVTEVQFPFADSLIGCPLSPSMVQNWCEQAGDAAIDAIFAPIFDQTFINESVLDYGLPETEVRNRFSSLKSYFKTTLHPAWGSWVAPAYGMPGTFATRIGSSNPFLGDAQSASSTVAQGFSTGFTGLLAPGQDPIELLPQMVDFQLNTGAIGQLISDGTLQVLQTGQVPAIPGDTVLVNKAGLKATVGYNPDSSTSISTTLRAGAANITKDSAAGAYLEGGFSYTKQVDGWVTKSIGASVRKDPGEPVSAFFQMYLSH